MTKRRTSRKSAATITPYIIVNGASVAIEFYKNVFGAKEISKTFVEQSEKVEHAELKIGSLNLFLCDEAPLLGVVAPTSLGNSSTLFNLTVSNAQDVWEKALANGAVEIASGSKLPFSGYIGRFVDPFGHFWSISEANPVQENKIDEVNSEESQVDLEAEEIPNLLNIQKPAA